MGWNELIGTELGPYQILEELGRGGSAHVYRALDTRTQHDVAIKVIPNDAEDRDSFVQRFEREVVAVQALNHPNIVAIYDSGKTDELVYLVMQYVAGGTLRQRFGRPLPTADAVHYLIQMAHALHHAHRQGIVHRDVKPSNMLVDDADPRTVLLTDFGIAKIQGARALTKSGTTIGTPEYMAPEQAESREVDQRADIYALGCVLYEALAGRPPFVGSSPVSVLYQHVYSRPMYIRAYNPNVPRELVHILDMCLAKRADERYGTAESFAHALYPFAEGRAQAEIASGMLGGSAQTPGSSHASAGPAPFVRTRPETVLPATTMLPHRQAVASAQQTLTDRLIVSPLPPVEGKRPPAKPAARATGAPTTESQTAPQETLRPRPSKHTIPLPEFRLPPKGIPPTEEPPIDVATLFEQLERGVSPAHGQSPASPLGPGMPQDRPPRYVPGGASDVVAPRTWYDGPEAPAPAGYHLTAQPLRAVPRSAERPPPEPIWRPELEFPEPTENTWSGSAINRRRRQLVRGGAVLAALLVAAVLIWTGANAAFGRQRPVVRPTPTVTVVPTATATPLPTATTTPPPPATATINPQVALDQRAAAAFRSVTVGRYSDGGCTPSNGTTRFGQGESIFVNVCTSDSPPPGPLSVAITQNGQVVAPLANNFYLGPSSSYWFATYRGLAPGNYQVLVTMQVDSVRSTARVINISVG